MSIDITEVNISMCEKADEIQKNHQPQRYDFVWLVGRKQIDVLVDVELYDSKETIFVPLSSAMRGIMGTIEREKFIWLPRQDQLQKMVKQLLQLNSPTLFVYAIWSWQYKESNEILDKVRGSMEQLWLAFAMHELYHKWWNGADWILEVQP